MRRWVAEALGTFILVFAGTGALPTAEAQRLSVRHTEITPAVARFAGSVAGVWQTEGFSP